MKQEQEWISLIDPTETRECPNYLIVEVKGHTGDDTISKAYYSTYMSDWMGIRGDPTHWRFIKK